VIDGLCQPSSALSATLVEALRIWRAKSGSNCCIFLLNPQTLRTIAMIT
jgi:hypothetical protein